MSDLHPELISEHFRLYRDSNAYGETLHLRKHEHTHVLLLQPYNDWAAQHFDPRRNEQHFLCMLEKAYAKGYAAAQATIRKGLGIP
jgi:hypothetical protein